MKTMNFKKGKSIGKRLLYSLLLIGGIMLSGYKSYACHANFTYAAGVNGHYTFTSTSTGFSSPYYSWNPGDGSGWQSGGITFAHTYTANTTYSVELLVMDSTCADSIVIPITVTNVTSPCVLSANFTASVGAHGVVTFTSTSTGTNANTLYFWAPGDSNIYVQGSTTYIHKYLYQGSYGVWLTVEDTGSAYCIDSIYEVISVPTADSSHCHVHASFTYTVGVNGLVSFTNTSTGTSFGTWYTWDPGDTTGTSSTTNYSHTYNYNNTYNVKLVVNDSGCIDSIIIPVTVTTACNMVASFTVTYDTNTDNGQVFFTSTSLGTNVNTVYKWTFGDGTPTTVGADTITHWYPFNGTYTVNLQDSNLTGCTTSTTMIISVTEKDSLQACFTYKSDTLLSGTYDFDASCSRGTNSDTYYKWVWGDATPSDSGLGLSYDTHTYAINGPYAATLTIWYTVLPTIKHTHSSSNRFSESSYTLTVNVTTVTGIQSITDATTYNVYPNPNNGMFKIAVNGLANDKNAEIRISNLLGEVIYQNNSSVANGKVLSDINLPNIKDGIYLLQVISAGNTYTSRISVQK